MYQTANAMMARGFIENHFRDLFHPQVYVLVNGRPGLLLLAYPVCALIAAVFQVTLGGGLDFWGRMQAVLFFMGSCIFIFQLVSYLVDRKIAFASLIAFTLFPLTLIYGQSFQNEMLTVFFTLTFLYFAVRAVDQKSFLRIILAALSFSLVLITRPNFATLGLPLLVYLFQKGEEPRDQFHRRLFTFIWIILISLFIPTLWYSHLWKTSHEANNIYSTLFAQLQVRSSFASPIVFQSNYYQEFADMLTGMVLTPVGFGLWLIGILAFRPFKNHLFFYLWTLSFAITGILMPRKLIEHEFYWLQFLLPSATFAGAAFFSFIKTQSINTLCSKIKILLFIACVGVVSLRYSAHPAFKTSAEDKNLIRIAERIKEVTEKTSSRIIVQGSHPVLYYADRCGWPFSLKTYDAAPDYYLHANWEKLPKKQWVERNQAIKNPVSNLEYLRKYEGATHLLILKTTEFWAHRAFADYVMTHYRQSAGEKDVFLLFDIQKIKSATDTP